MNQKTFEAKMSLYLRDELDAREKAQIDNLCREHPELQALMTQARQLEELSLLSAKRQDSQARIDMQGFENRLQSRLLDSAMDATEVMRRLRKRLHMSIAVNALVIGAVFALFLNPLLLRSGAHPWLDAPAEGEKSSFASGGDGRFTPASLNTFFRESEKLYGDRLTFVALLHGKFMLGIENDPPSAELQTGLPLLLLHYDLVLVAPEGKRQIFQSSSILIRSGHQARTTITGGLGELSMQVQVDSLAVRSGQVRISTQLEVADMGTSARALLSNHDAIALNERSKLGQFKLGDSLFDVFLSVETVSETEARHGAAA